MDVVESDPRIMDVKRWKTRALESYGKEKAPLSCEKSRPKSKGPYCSSSSRRYNLFS